MSNFDNVSQEWRTRIKSIQTTKASPEVVENLKQNAERSRRLKSSWQAASRLQRVNYFSSLSNAQTLKDYKKISTNTHDSSEFRNASADYMQRSNTIQSVLTNRPNVSVAAPVSRDIPPQVVEEDNFCDTLDEDLQVIEESLGIKSHNITNDEIEKEQIEVANQVDNLLLQLKVEPTNSDEILAKFQLFEKFLETVTAIRETTMKFWEERKDEFNGPLQLAQQKEIDAIDRPDNLGILDDSTSWFVYDMTKQANQNSKSINRVLSSLTSRLNMLSQELGECPFCLDPLQRDNLVTLSCCHRTCRDCWNHWSQLKGNTVFCPLCNHREFVEEVIGNF